MKEYNLNDRHVITLDGQKDLALYTEDLHVWYGQNEAIKGVDMQFEKNKITALIGPSGCGKSTYLRSLNRMNDSIANTKVTGEASGKTTCMTVSQRDKPNAKPASRWVK